MCQVFEGSFGINPERLNDEQVTTVLSQLVVVPDLGDHWIQQFLSFAAKRNPMAVVELFIERIEHRADDGDSDFRPLPFQAHIDFRTVIKHPDYPNVLRKLRDLALNPSWHYSYFGADLFWSVAQDDVVLDVLREWINTNQKERIVAVAQILEKGGENFVFSNPEFVSFILEAAAAVDDECYRDVFSYLHSSANSGTKSGVVGQPMPRDMEISEKASLLVNRFAVQPKVRGFYESLVKGAAMNIQQDRERFEEMFPED